jgi:3-isopropylmalate/(R)-2-methylmalate dehydratase small subunit
MQPLSRLDAVAVPLPQANVDTDQIVPALYLQKPRACDFGEFLFRDVRRDAAGSPRPEFPLNRPEFADASILVAGRNFGCGSSREHAVWALVDGGFRAVVAPSFGDIFASNAVKNGLLTVPLPEVTVEALLEALQRAPGAHVRIDLAAQTLTSPDGTATPFAIDPFARHCLLEGIDELGFTLSQVARIEAYEKATGPA